VKSQGMRVQLQLLCFLQDSASLEHLASAPHDIVLCYHQRRVLTLVAGSSGSAAPEGPGIPASLRPPLT
jgi:hypothetical protein